MLQEITFWLANEVHMGKPSLQVEETDGTW